MLSNKPRRVCVFTGSRSEYGLMRFLIKAVEEQVELNLQLIVTGSHLSELHGRTVSEIESDGVPISSVLPISINSNSGVTMGDLGAETMKSVSVALKELNPDIMVILGDRYEAFSAAGAAFLNRIPILHIHGGETTEGAIDNNLRHAITQLSSWHFTSAEKYSERVIQMGIPKDRVFEVGPMVIDALASPIKVCRNDFESRTGFQFGSKNALVTFHPETLLPDNGLGCFKELIRALEKSDLHILFTYPNADQGFQDIVLQIERFVSNNRRKRWAIPSLGQDLYLKALHLFDVMVGNTSSGIIEGPLLGIPSINVGNRQQGRLRFGLVQDASCDSKEILSKLANVRSRDKSSDNKPFKLRSKPSEQIIRFLVNQAEF